MPDLTPEPPDPAAERERALIDLARTRIAPWPRGTAAVPSVPPGPRHLPECVGKYQIRHLIATGGMGAVYAAEQTDLGRLVAIKVVKSAHLVDAFRRRFELEARLLARLHHPGIACIYETGTVETDEGPLPYLAMEHVAGDRLTDYALLHDLDTRTRVELLLHVCEALQHAHDRGVVHRDLKPANILVDETGRPKILDFGIARVVAGDLTTITQQTVWGQALGTVPYMSPEQATGQLTEIDARSDIYSLGVVAYELLTGILPLPLRGRSVGEALRAIRDDPPLRLGEADETLRGPLEAIVAKALEKRPADRYASVAQLGGDLRRYLRSEPVRARHRGLPSRMFRWLRENPLAAALLVTLIVLAGVIWDRAPWRRREKHPASAGTSAEGGAERRAGAAPATIANQVGDAALIVADSFEYPPGKLEGHQGGLGIWKGAWTGPTQFVEPAGLEYRDSAGDQLAVAGPSVRTSFGSASFREIDLADDRDVGRLQLIDPGSGLLGRDGTTLWLSLLAACDEPGENSAHLWGAVSLFTKTNADGTDTISLGKNADGPFVWGVGGSAVGERFASQVSTSQPVWIVAKFEFRPGRETLMVWFNPAIAMEPSPDSAAIVRQVHDFRFDRLRLAGCDLFRFDEIRLGSSFGAVAPRRRE